MQPDSASIATSAPKKDASASAIGDSARDSRIDRAGRRANTFITSWSGGKDSCLALERAKQSGLDPAGLFTMFTEGGERSRSHGLTHVVLRAQAEAMGLRLFTNNATWADYESVFIDAWREFRLRGITTGVFGDIDIEDHRAWVQRVCAAADMRALHPLWQEPRRALLEEFIDKGFRATVIAVREGVLDRNFLGRSVDRQLIDEFESLGIDACGENGEYHTVVTDGPLFQVPMHLAQGEATCHSGVWFLDVTPVRG